MKSKLIILSIVWLCLLLFNGCASLGYYYQSVAGQMEIFSKEQEVADILLDPKQSPELKQKLALVLDIRQFASEQLALPENDSYRSYVDLQRPYVVWNVFAAPEFSFELKEWCFFVVGCVRYRGYFSEQDAQGYAQLLQQDGLEVYVTGVAAYSTLGWFDDPMLNTILQRKEIYLAELIFHELAHQVLYINGDTAFNEAFASTVGAEGVRRWAEQRGKEDLIREYQAHKQRGQAFSRLVKQTRETLAALYAQKISAEDKRASKRQTIEKMRQSYARLKTQWHDYPGYDRWFSQDINNAQMAATSTYTNYVPAFMQLLHQVDNDLLRFYQVVKDISVLETEQRTARMNQLMETANPQDS